MIRIILICILVLLILRVLAISRKDFMKKPEIRFDSKMYKRKGLFGSIGKMKVERNLKKR